MADAWGSGLRKGFLTKTAKSKTAESKASKEATRERADSSSFKITSSNTGVTVLSFDEDFTLRSANTFDEDFTLPSASTDAENGAKTTTEDFENDFQRVDISSSSGLAVQRFEQDTDLIIRGGEIFMRPSVISDRDVDLLDVGDDMDDTAVTKARNPHLAKELLKIERTVNTVQLRLLTEFLQWAKATKPDIATVSLMWDETSQTLALPAVHGSGAHQQRSSWQVLVARLHFCIGFVGGPGKSNLKLYRECVLAPVPLPTNSSSAISSGLRNHPMNKEILRIVQELLDCSRLRFVLHEADAHLANEKLHFHHYNLEKQRAAGQSPIFTEWVKCGNHQVHLVMCDAVEQCPKAADSGGRLLQNLFCASLWLRMGGHFLRLLASLAHLVQDEKFLRWVPNPTPQDRSWGRSFRQELCSYLQDNLRHHERQMAADPAQGVRSSKGLQRLAADIEHCFGGVLNGADASFTRGLFVHICNNGCCSSRREAEQKVTWAIMKVLFRLIPTVPLMSDWSKLGPCLDFFLASDYNGLLERLLDAAQWAQQANQCEPPPDRDPDVDDKVNWQALAGRRFNRFRQMMSSPQERFERVLLAITTEPLRQIHDTYLKFAHTACDSQTWPKLLSEVWPRTSKNHAVMQYYATCLQGKTSRLALLVNLSGDHDMLAWMRERQHEALSARAKILMISTELQQRFASNLDRQPWQLFGLADCRELKEMLSEPEFVGDLLSWRWMFLLSSLIMKLSIASVEQRHARHKLSANPSTPFHTFAATSILQEARHQASAVERLEEERKRRAVGLDVPAQPLLDQVAHGVQDRQDVHLADGRGARKRARSLPVGGGAEGKTSRPKAMGAFELFRHDWIQGQRASGKAFNPVSKESWNACKAAFNALPPARREEFENRRLASQLRADFERLQRNASQAPAGPDLEMVAQAPPEQEDPSREDRWRAMMQGLGPADGSPDASKPPFPDHVTCQSLRAPLVDQASGQGINVPSRLAEMESFPLEAGALRERWFCAKVHLEKEIQEFRRRATRFVSGCDMPDRVEYPACCGALCRTQNTRRSILFHSRLLDLLKTVVQTGCAKPKGWAKLVPAANICLAAECYVDGAPTMADRPARPSSVMFFAASASSALGVVLQCCYEQYEAPCRLRWLSEDALAARLCFVDAKPVAHVRVRLLKWTLDDAAPRLDRHRIVELGEVFDATSQREPQEPRQPAPARPDQDGSNDFDLLDDLTHDRKPKVSRRRLIAIEDQPKGVDSDKESETGEVKDADAESLLEELENMGDEEAWLEDGAAAEVGEADVPHEQPGADTGNDFRAEDASVVGVADGPVPPEPFAGGADSCDIEDVGGWHFRRKSDNTDVGRLHQIGVDTLKATCKLHRSCVCVISSPPLGSERLRTVSARLQRAPTLHDTEADLVKWLDAGLTATATQYQEASLDLRSGSWAVRVRRPKAGARA
ncbi:unnamed protein product [Symbiodinium necroappetens]|uniref:Uncharacterized protein n=1 Tax=Symbiodinium necroappetens TaxID=1628268 RepID=A0A813BC95_9DINO|nr:unnamed protein product [Symbiodinium necroappetens]